MKNRKRILAGLLAVIMTISMLPASAFAAEPGGAAAENDADPAIVSNEEYEVEPTVEDISDQGTQEEAGAPSEEAGDKEAAEPEAESGTEPETQPEVIPSSEPEEVQPAQTENEAPKAEETAETTEEDGEPVILTYEGRDYMVTATFDPTVFPAGVQMKAREIRKSNSSYQDLYDQALETVQKETEEEVEITHARFFDITFYTEEEDNIEPDGAVNVNIKYTKALTVESTDDISVLHFDEKKEEPQLMEIETSGSRDDKVDEISFDTESFSVYAVIATEQTGNDARLTVNFYGKDTAADAAPIATMYVRTSDRADSDKMAEIVYDPEGELNLPDGYVFYGKWSVGNTDYTLPTDGRTIAEVRRYISGLSFAEGEVLNVYAVLFRDYTVRYLNRDGSTVGVDSVRVKNGETSKAYTVNMEYSDDDNHKFEGWRVTEGQANIAYANDTPPENGLHVNGLDVSISGDVEFSAVSPEGRWLIFNENGKHATYNAARFVYWGTNADFSNMKPMTRPGYTFAGWWTGPPSEYGEAPTGAEYDTENPGPITQTTTLYAKWDYSDLVPYSVVIWKEHAYDNDYEVGEIIHFEGRPFTEINTVIGHNTEGNNNAYVTVGGVNKVNTTIQALGDESKDPYEGFHLKTYDKNVIIQPTGDTILNVYYDRNVYKLKFTHRVYVPVPLDFTETIEEKYGAHIGPRFPIAPGIADGLEKYFLSWYPTTSPCYIYPEGNSHDIRYIDKMPAENIDFKSNINANLVGITLSYYVEALPGQTAAKTFTGSDGVQRDFVYYREIRLKDLYVAYDEQFAKMEGFERYGTDTNNNDHVNMQEHGSYTFPTSQARSGEMYFYYTRNKYNIHFTDGSYFDGNGNLMEEHDMGVLKTTDQYLYEEDVSSYNKNGADYYDASDKTPEGFVFEGWYHDKRCTVPYTFNTMTMNGITVYAKWQQIQYRVFLHPNAGTSASNPKEPFGPTQEMNFRVSYGDSISVPDGNWKGYRFLGWYLDEEMTEQVFSKNIILNKDTPTSVYNKETDMTDPMDKWGNLGSSPTNSDANRFWITRKYDLYAKWSRVLIGSQENGLYVKYWTEEDGITVPVDSVSHADNSEVVAALAPAEAPDGQVFRKWIVQVWNGSEFIDTNPAVEVDPGDTFFVHAEGAKIVVTGSNPEVVVAEADLDEDGHYTYIVQLRADFAETEKPSTTFIHWFKNYEDDEPTPYHTDTLVNGKKLAVNQAVGIPEAPEFIGHDFLGWAKVSMGADADAAETWMEHTDNYVQDLDADDLFLYYRKVEEDGIEVGKFYSDSSFQNEVTQVAADATAYEAMFAVWKKSTYTIIRSSDEEHPITREMEVTRKGNKYTVDKINLLDWLHDDYIYGGYYRYDEDGRGTAFDDQPGTDMTPAPGETYYLKEVDENYLKPQLFLVYSNSTRVIQKMYGLINVDSSDKKNPESEDAEDPGSEETENTESDYQGCGLLVGTGSVEKDLGLSTGLTDVIHVKKEGVQGDFKTLGKVNFGAPFSNSSFTGEFYIGCIDLSSYVAQNAELEIKAYYLTWDGIRVTGKKSRKIRFADTDPVKYIDWQQTKTGLAPSGPEYTFVEGSSETDGDGKSLQSSGMQFAKDRTLDVSVDPVVTKHNVPEDFKTQTVKPGDNTGRIEYPEKDNYLFTGWFEDEALTMPADFSNVQEDMEVYAGYIPRKDVTLSMARKTGKTGNVTFTATVTVKNINSFTEVGVFCGHNGTATEAALTKKTYVSTGTGKNYKFSGPAEVKGLVSTDSFTASVYWVTKDGTRVTEEPRTCTYKSGTVKVQY